MDEDYNMHEKMDIIFLRNVLIYFDKPTQERILTRLCKHLKPDGYIFLGHTENIFKMNLPLLQTAPATYKRI